MAKLHFFYSTMNAGKSTALLQSNHNYSESNLKTLLFIPKDLGDKSDGKIISRNKKFDEIYDFSLSK